jgi:hypothetical protein
MTKVDAKYSCAKRMALFRVATAYTHCSTLPKCDTIVTLNLKQEQLIGKMTQRREMACTLKLNSNLKRIITFVSFCCANDTGFVFFKRPLIIGNL